MATSVQSYNLFVDTERNLSPDSTGDNVYLPLGQTPITCGTNQFIKLTLNEFSMQKSFHDVNSLNNTVIVRDGSGEQILTLPPSNYTSSYKLFSDTNGFITPVKTVLDNLIGGGITTTITVITPIAANNNDLILQFKAQYSSPHGYTLATAPIFQCYVANGVSYMLFGGNRVVDPADTTTPSLTTTLGDENGANTTDTLTFTGFYNTNFFTSSHVYIRINEQNNNIGTSSLQSPKVDTQQSAMSNTKVLGMVPVDTGYIRYVAQSDNVFFADITSKQVSQLQIQITDAFGNLFPLISPQQNVLGNRNFRAVIRIDIMEYPSTNQNIPNAVNLEEKTAPMYSSAPSTKVGLLQSNGLNGPQSGLLGNGFYNFQGKLIN